MTRTYPSFSSALFRLAHILLVFVTFAVFSVESASIPVPAGLISRQATREQVVARMIPARHGLKRRATPSAVIGSCGIVEGSLFVVKFLSRAGSPSIYTPSAPAYLTAESVGLNGAASPRVNTALASAQMFTLDSTNGCALVDVSVDNYKLYAIPDAVQGGGSTMAFADSATDAKQFSPERTFSPISCVASKGSMQCMFQGGSQTIAFTAAGQPDYNDPESDTLTYDDAYLSACYEGGTCEDPLLDVIIMPV